MGRSSAFVAFLVLVCIASTDAQRARGQRQRRNAEQRERRQLNDVPLTSVRLAPEVLGKRYEAHRRGKKGQKK